MARTYSNRSEAITREIIEAIESGDVTRDQYDIEAIADAVIGSFEDGYALQVDEASFWGIVAENEI